MKNSISKLMALALLAVIVGCGPKAAEHAEGDGHDHAKEEGGGHDERELLSWTRPERPLALKQSRPRSAS